MKSIILTILFFLSISQAWAEEPPKAQPGLETGEQVDVSKITDKYWAQGKDTELGVVQNRKYTSSGRLELGLLAGTTSTDPFLSVHQYGLSLGYHFNQYFSAHLIGWKDSVSPSDAYRAFQAQNPGYGVGTNAPKNFYGVQFNENFLYGKASLFGNTIIYVDLFLLGGFGINNATNGNSFAPFLGLGQNIHLNQYMAIHLDYRIMHFSENVPYQGSLQQRSNNTDAVTLGLSLFY